MDNQDFIIEIVYCRRKSVSLQVLPSGKIRIRAPYGISKKYISVLLNEKREWILKRIQKTDCNHDISPLSDSQLKQLRSDALADLELRAKNYSAIIGVSYKKISIRSQRTRWGSCSSSGNINLNCLLMLAPPEIRDYVVVHELCHLLEMNHSAAFWSLVERILPDYRERRQWLKDNGPALMSRLP